MKHRILFGTTNRAKIEIVRAFLEPLPIEMISALDAEIYLEVEEDGATAQENAEKKARAYYNAARIPTFAIDAGLEIRGFPPEKQPGVYVRRIFGAGREVSDEEMLAHYSGELERIGEKCVAVWRLGLAFAVSESRVYVDTYSFEAEMTPKASPKRLPGAPLSSLMLDARTGAYLSEMDHRQRADAVWVQQIMRTNLQRMAQS
jgi:inosine/xanthosine triphosphate pyrophosphatase family protein